MFYITEAQAKHFTHLACGHTVETDQVYYKLTVNVCAHDLDGLPRAIKASLQAQQTITPPRNASFLYRLWHWCFGKKFKQPQLKSSVARPTITSSSERQVIPMPQVKKYVAKQDLQLDCGHAIKAGETLVVTSVYTCEKEGTWPLAILKGCFHALQEQQTVKQPVNGEKKHLTHSVSKRHGAGPTHP